MVTSLKEFPGLPTSLAPLSGQNPIYGIPLGGCTTVATHTEIFPGTNDRKKKHA
jgi:hypothetical protein